MPQLLSFRKRINKETYAKFCSSSVWSWSYSTEFIFLVHLTTRCLLHSTVEVLAGASLKWELSFFRDAPSQYICLHSHKTTKSYQHGNWILSCTTENPRLACTAQTVLTWRVAVLTFSSDHWWAFKVNFSRCSHLLCFCLNCKQSWNIPMEFLETEPEPAFQMQVFHLQYHTRVGLKYPKTCTV